MFAQILEAFKALSELIKLVKGLFAFIKENKEQAWFKESGEVFSKLASPETTVEEKREAAKKIRDLINGI